MEYISTVEPIEHLVELFWRKMQQRTPDTHSIPGTGSIVLGIAPASWDNSRLWG
jgi:hypothetical protein